jgi:type VI secretion system protein ImpH
MASPDRRSARDLIAEIGTEAPRFRFFQAVRLITLTDKKQSTPPTLRFGSPLSLGFPASEITAAQYKKEAEETEHGAREDRGEMHLSVGFMGMTGPSAALPVAYTEALIERRNFHRDTAAHGFLDMFTHRSVSLFYQAWRKYRFHIAYEAGDRDGFTRNMLDLVGAGLKSVHPIEAPEEGIPSMLLSHFAGLLSQRPMSATSLAALLRGYFRVAVSVEQFVGQWIVLPASEQSRLGLGNCTLGETGIAGERVWDRQNKMTVRIGPLDNCRFADFLPGRPGAIALCRLVEFCVGQTLACDVELIMKKECVQAAVLSTAGTDQLRLGYNTWLHRQVPPDHQENACFSILN